MENKLKKASAQVKPGRIMNQFRNGKGKADGAILIGKGTRLLFNGKKVREMGRRVIRAFHPWGRVGLFSGRSASKDPAGLG